LAVIVLRLPFQTLSGLQRPRSFVFFFFFFVRSFVRHFSVAFVVAPSSGQRKGVALPMGGRVFSAHTQLSFNPSSYLDLLPHFERILFSACYTPVHGSILYTLKACVVVLLSRPGSYFLYDASVIDSDQWQCTWHLL
jgi:hypothetical protein